MDVSDTDEVKNVFKQIITEIGQIDVLVNNAGYGIFRSAHEESIEEIKRDVCCECHRLMACTSMVLPLMMKQRQAYY